MAKITNQFISKCEKQVIGQDKTFWDEELRGFGIRIRPSGRKVFIVQYRNELGRTRKFTLGTHGVLTPQEARTKAKIILGRVAAGEDPANERKTNRTVKTIAELCDEHLQLSKGRVKASTWAMDESRIECHVKPLIGSKPVKSIKPSDVERFVQDVMNGKSATTGKKRGRGGRISGGPGGCRACCCDAWNRAATCRPRRDASPQPGSRNCPSETSSQKTTLFL
ncbi:MAG: integrase arm-type DNA-binding domain-containing protein [Hyphomicrobiales bacterium]|nr:integrase arm-type DNA-binding domain-containing protein [Hyphomicrobiales bacterium]